MSIRSRPPRTNGIIRINKEHNTGGLMVQCKASRLRDAFLVWSREFGVDAQLSIVISAVNSIVLTPDSRLTTVPVSRLIRKNPPFVK